jgi:outer membrane lipoprotein-sorting protein
MTLSLYALTGEEILAKMDLNRDFNSITYEGTMEITIGNEKRVKTMKTTAMSGAVRKAVVEYTNAEDRGTRYLLIGDNLWIYFPDEDDVVKISGHMLKEGMMGSDVSYEDALESDKLTDKYSVTVGSDTALDGNACWKIVLNAKVKTVPYDKREMVVDKKSFICRQERMFAVSGKLLKESSVLAVGEIDGRVVPVRTMMVNKLRSNSRTVFSLSNVLFNTGVDESLFTLRNLGK